MNVKFYLAKPSAKVSPIRVVVTHHNKIFQKATGISVEVSQWSRTKQKSSNVKAQEKLRLIRTGLESMLDDFSTEEAISAAFSHIVKGEWVELPPEPKKPIETAFWLYFREWADRPSNAQRQKQLTYRVIREIMGTGDDWDDINEAWYTRFVLECDKRGYSRNNTGTMIGRLKTVLHEGQKLGYHHNDYWREMKRFKEDTSAIYLTDAEAELIMNYESKLSIERKTVAIFTACYKTGARFSDAVRLTEDNITGNRVSYIALKTGKQAVVPLSARVSEVMSRNNGRVPKLSQQKYNETLKEIGKNVGLTQEVEIVKSVGSEKRVLRMPKYKCLSSHTARRSILTNLYLSGVSAKDCMVLSQHTTLQVFETYLKMTHEQQLKTLESNSLLK